MRDALHRGRQAGRDVTRKARSYSTWWNGGLRTIAYFHNQIGILTETIGNPTPISIPFIAALRDRRLEHLVADPAAGRSGTSASRSTTRSRPTARFSTTRRATARRTALPHLPDGPRQDRSGAARITGRSRRTRSAKVEIGDVRHVDDPDRGRARRAAAVTLARGGGAARWRRWRWRTRRRRLRVSALRGADDEGAARSARLHHAVRSAGLRHGRALRQRADQVGHHRACARPRRSPWPASSTRRTRSS